MQKASLKGARLSLQQERLWSLRDTNDIYYVHGEVLIQGRLDVAMLRHSLQQIVEQYEILHTIFYAPEGMDMPVQVIDRCCALECPVVDLGVLQTSVYETSGAVYAASVLREPFDLVRGPLFHALLLRFSTEKHLLLLSISAWCADTITLPFLISELSQRYAACSQGEAYDEEEPLQYIDVVAWQNKWLASENAQIAADFWKRVDLSHSGNQPLPFEHERREAGSSVVADPYKRVNIPLEQEAVQRMHALARRYEVSLSSLLLACWHLLLCRLTGEKSLLIGVASNGRLYEELENVLGSYTRFVPVRNYSTDQWNFVQLFSSVEKTLGEVAQWQPYFTWTAQSDNKHGSDLSSEFLPMAFEYTEAPDLLHAGSVTFTLSQLYGCTEPFALKLDAFHTEERLNLALQYHAKYATAVQVERLASCFLALLQDALKRPLEPVGTLKLLALAEEEYVRTAFRTPPLPLPVQGLHQLFEQWVKEQPDQLAVLSGEEELTYQEVNERANQLACLLRQHGAGPNVLVGLCFTRSAQMLVGLLAIFKAGGGYVPLDPDSPSARIAYQLEDTGTQLLLTQQALLSRLPQWDGRVLCIETLQQELRRQPVENQSVQTSASDIAYIIYTSGSTGLPKGVMIQHRSVVNYVLSLGGILGVEAGWQYATVSTLAADLGNTAIFCALASGGCIHILDYETITSGETFARWVASHPIDVLKIVPSHISALLASGQADKILPRRALVLGGEVLPPSLLARLYTHASGMRVFNHYGPTETTIGVLVNPLRREMARDGSTWDDECGSVALGHPIAGIDVYILDRQLQMVPREVTGELFVGGEGLALGYLHQPEQTAERFVSHPFSAQPGARLYRTGDLARYTAQGEIEFVGRHDYQIKLRGYRIELGEIEAILRKHPAVWDCAVMMREDTPGEKRLVGYIASRVQPAPSNEELRSFVRGHLPEYMVPYLFIMLKDLPLTANGKVDRHRLPAPQPEQQDEEAILNAPRSPVEEIVLEIWRDLLAVPTIGIFDDFFRLGGHSLLATQVIARVRALLRVELSVLDFFEAPTISAQARQIEHALRGDQPLDVPPLVPQPRERPLPLSFAQQRLWFLEQLEPESTAYLMVRHWSVPGPLSAQALERSFMALTQRHESLRTTFCVEGDQPVQVVHPPQPFRLPLLDLSALEPERQRTQVRALIEQERQYPFQLERSFPLRTFLLRLNDIMHVVLVAMHHIISDAWSNNVFMRDLRAFYRAFESDQIPSLPPLLIQYADFAVWQRQWLQGQVLESQLSYWKQQLADISPLDLPTDYPRPSMQTYQGASCFLWLPAELRNELLALCQGENVTLFMLLLAAFQVLLARYSGQTDVSVGTPIANRTHIELENLIGFFVNTLVLRSDLSGNPTFLDVLQRVRVTASGAYAHQDMPFERLVELLHPERDLGRSPLFQVFFSVDTQHTTFASSEGKEERGRVLMEREGSREDEVVKFDLEFSAVSTDQGIYCDLQYNKALFAPVTIRRFLTQFQTLLESITAHPEQRIAYLPLLTPEERCFLLEECNATQRDFPLQQSFIQLFSAQAARMPHEIAVVYGETQMSYGELEQQANLLASVLRRKDVGPETLVGLYMQRSLEMLVAILAIFKAGGAYLPLDPAYPPQRSEFILRNAGVEVVIIQPGLQWPLSTLPKVLIPLKIGELQVAETIDSSLSPHFYHPAQLAYVIYTSGSTGQPKGAMVTQRGMLNHLFAKVEELKLSSNDVVAQTASHCFDISVWQFLALLLVGGTIHILPDEIALDPFALFSHIAMTPISILEMVPSLLRTFLDGSEAQPVAYTTHRLRWLIVTGELLTADVGLRWLRRYPEVRMLNAYGPTECSDDVTHALLTEELLSKRPGAPVGQAIANTQLYILDEYLQPVAPGVPGQIYVGGIGVGRGYRGDPARSAVVFIPNPFAARPGERLYTTGDVGRYREDWQIEFLKRSDHQVKIHGYRIELGEIETALREYPGISDAVVIWRVESPTEGRLLGYVVWRSRSEEGGEEQRLKALRDYLRGRLPHYMQPAALVELQELPLNANGKVDRKQLPEPETVLQEVANDEGGQKQLGQVEEILRMLWQEVLGHPLKSGRENFFEQGGHSLLATQLAARIRTILQVEVGVRMIFEKPDIQEQARWIEQALQEQRGMMWEEITPVERDKALPLSFAQQRLWFMAQLEPESTAYLVPLVHSIHSRLDISILEQSFRQLIVRHESLRTTFENRGGEPVQVIHAPEAVFFSLPLIELSDLSAEERAILTSDLLEQERRYPCDLVHGPLLRVTLLRLAYDSYVLLVTMHHIITDGWSGGIFLRDLVALYRANEEKRSAPLTPLSIQYADYAVWQRGQMQGELLETQLNYWLQHLNGVAALKLPLDHPRSARGSQRGVVHHFSLDRKLSRALQELSNQHNVTVFMTLLAAFQVLLHRYSGQTDILVGTDSANRSRRELEEVIGFFINLLPLRTNLSGKPSFIMLLQRVRKTVLDAYTYQETPFELLVEKLLPEHTRDHMPLIQALFVMQNLPFLSGASERGVAFEQDTNYDEEDDALFLQMNDVERAAKFDLALFMFEQRGRLCGALNYSKDIFEAKTIALMTARFKTLLQSIVEHPDYPVDKLNFFTDAEWRQPRSERRSRLSRQNSERIDLSEIDFGRRDSVPE